MIKLTEPGVAARLKSDRAFGQARALRKTEQSHLRKQAAIGPFIVDFVCHGARLIVELDGGVHNEPEAQARDSGRQAFLEGRG